MELAIEKLAAYPSGDRYEGFIQGLKDPNLALFNKVRTDIIRYATDYMHEMRFLHPPVNMFSPLTDPLNHETHPARMDYYGKEYSLMQSLIFHKMALVSVSPIKKAFWLSPNIRLESSIDGKKYATEFTQLDFEISMWTWDMASTFVEGLLMHIIEKLGLQGQVTPVCITNLKREAYDKRSGEHYLNFDFEINGIEVCSGAEREWEYEKLKARMEELNYPLAYFEPVLRMAKDGLLRPSAGAGIGIERLTKALCGLEDISKIYPFPRRPKEMLVM